MSNLRLAILLGLVTHEELPASPRRISAGMSPAASRPKSRTSNSHLSRAASSSTWVSPGFRSALKGRRSGSGHTSQVEGHCSRKAI